jgi:cardiolipin synthase
VFASWLADIAAAQRYILLENYIFSGDRIGTRIADALIERAQAGVEVYVLYDWFGAIATSGQFWRRLKRAGVKVRAFKPFSWLTPLHSVQRNHRKALCVDGVVGSVGGLCIGDSWAGSEFIAEPASDRPQRRQSSVVPPWRDTAVRIVGPAAFELCLAFDETWALCGPSLPARLFHDPLPETIEHHQKRQQLCPDSTESPVRVVAGLPGRSRIYRLTQVLITNAMSRIWITDAYFLTPPTMYEALVAAARDGVDVRVLLPGRSDLPVIAWMGRAGFIGLLEAGVRIFEWDGPMLHAKTTVVDGKASRIGSSNLNLASLLANWELDIVIEDARFGAAMEQQFLRDLGQATELVLRSTRLRTRIQRAEVATQPPPPTRRALLGPRPGVAVARAGALVLGVALRRHYGQSTVSVSTAAAVGLLGLSGVSFFYPTAVGIVLSGVLLWLAAGLLLRALGALVDGQKRRKRRRRQAVSSQGGDGS